MTCILGYRRSVYRRLAVRREQKVEGSRYARRGGMKTWLISIERTVTNSYVVVGCSGAQCCASRIAKSMKSGSRPGPIRGPFFFPSVSFPFIVFHLIYVVSLPSVPAPWSLVSALNSLAMSAARYGNAMLLDILSCLFSTTSTGRCIMLIRYVARFGHCNFSRTFLGLACIRYTCRELVYLEGISQEREREEKRSLFVRAMLYISTYLPTYRE